MLSCKEVSRLVASGELDDAGPVLKLRVRFHFLLCSRCRRYAEQMRIIGSVARERMSGLLPDAQLASRLEESILEQALGPNQHN